ncbi:MAG TPA: TIGR03621 family F420-dependent LLM class oxidoreductase [Trebonia sp.]|jgi:probable F420-dependent oxidoreductase|nr:TIGR03621 family F420-dependent LLM class oxidoreductase [Trebonia sp.]
MTSARDFRFSTNFMGLRGRDAVVAYAKRVEELGYDTLFAADHLGSTAPFQMLIAAAGVTSRLRLGTLVLNVPFWNPALLAREIVTADQLTDGRLEVGLGSGHMKWEFDAASIPWEGFGARASRLEETIAEISTILSRGGYAERRQVEEHFNLKPLAPLQESGFGGYGPPLLVAGTGERVLRIAARYADIIGIAGTKQITGRAPGAFRLCTAAETDDVVRFARAEAGSRADSVEWNVLVQLVKETGDRLGVAAEVATEDDATMTPQEVMETPFLLFGTVDEMAAQVLRNRERFGFTYYTVHGHYMEAFAPVIERVRALAARD